MKKALSLALITAAFIGCSADGIFYGNVQGEFPDYVRWSKSITGSCATDDLCSEDIIQDDCVYTFVSNGICSTTSYPYCYYYGCYQINSTITKEACFSAGGNLVTAEICEED